MLRDDTQEFPKGDAEINHREAEQMKMNKIFTTKSCGFFVVVVKKKKKSKPETKPNQRKTPKQNKSTKQRCIAFL